MILTDAILQRYNHDRSTN